MRAIKPTLTRHSVGSAISPPIPALDLTAGGEHEPLLELDLNCPSVASFTVTVTNGASSSLGSQYFDLNGTQIFLKSDPGDTLAINCLAGPPTATPTFTNTPTPTRTPTPTVTPKQPDGDTDGDTIPNGSDDDDDGDGCTDVQEAGSNQFAGGLRNPHNYWDLYNVPTGMWPNVSQDKAVTIADFFAVLGRFGAEGTATSYADAIAPPPAPPAYHAAYDRGASFGPYSWSLTQADGNLAGPDFFRVLNQFGTTCE